MPETEAISVRIYGKDGPAVVLLHGGPGAPGRMAPVARILENRFRVLEPLQRRSDGAPMTVERHVDDLRIALRDVAGKKAVRLVGHSWGAMLALTFAARHSEGIERVILIGCGTFDVLARQAYRTDMARRIESEPEAKRHIDHFETQLASESDHRRLDALFTEYGAITTRLQGFDPLEADADAPPCDERGFHETWNNALALQANGTQPEEFKNIRVPVTMIHGAEDPHPGPLIHASLTPFIKRIQYRELAQCGHTPWLERRSRTEFEALLTACLE